MHSFFPVFAYHLQNQTSEQVSIGIMTSLADADLSDNGLYIAAYRNEETQSIKDQGYESQYRLKIDFKYSVAIISNVSEAHCNEQATALLAVLTPGIDLSVAYNSASYSMYFSEIKDVCEYKNEITGWVETLTFTGYTFLKVI